MAKIPHKSIWKERKKEPEEAVVEKKKEETITVNDEVREKLKKLKRNVMILCIILIAPVIMMFIIPVIMLYLQFVMFLAVVIGVFFVYFPISDLLKKTEK